MLFIAIAKIVNGNVEQDGEGGKDAAYYETSRLVEAADQAEAETKAKGYFFDQEDANNPGQWITCQFRTENPDAHCIGVNVMAPII